MDILARTVTDKLMGEADKAFVSVLIGPRQVGKTVLMRSIGHRLGRKCTYLDAENPEDMLVFGDGLRSLIAQIGREPQVLLLDEFHRIPEPLLLFKQIQDGYPEIKVYASGSSSIEIQQKLTQSAVGRVRRTRVFPLSFLEFSAGRADVDLAKWDVTQMLPPREADGLRRQLDQFMVWGGMPELLHAESEPERREILREIVGLYLERDVRSLLRSDEVLRFNEFLRLVALNVGQTMNRAHFGRALNLTSRQTERQLLVMEHTWVYRPVSTDYSNPTKRLTKAPKVYWYDNGIRNALLKDFRPMGNRPDRGALLENHVFVELEKSAGPDISILYHRTHDGQEIDFILELDGRKLLVEVKSSMHRPTIPAAFHDMLARDDAMAGVVLNDGFHKTDETVDKPVYFLPHCLAHRVPSLLHRLRTPQ